MGTTLVYFTSSVAAANLVAVAVWPLLRLGAKRNLLAMGMAVVAIAACPALIPAEHVVARALACLLGIDPWFRVVDYARQLRKGTVSPVTWRGYCTFIIPFPFLLVVFGQKQRAERSRDFSGANLFRLVAGLAVCAAAVILCSKSHQVAALRDSFLLDHLLKLLIFTLFVEAASQFQTALERLCGYDALPLIDRAYLARTPGEFWFRYNQRVRQWLHDNVFVPCGGRRAPLRAVCAVFLVSAILHEFFFDLATSRVDGYQFAFFMLQAPAVLLSLRLEKLARRSAVGRVVAHSLTWLWFAATSMLFFHGLDRVFPIFYASQPWLP